MAAQRCRRAAKRQSAYETPPPRVDRRKLPMHVQCALHIPAGRHHVREAPAHAGAFERTRQNGRTNRPCVLRRSEVAGVRRSAALAARQDLESRDRLPAQSAGSRGIPGPVRRCRAGRSSRVRNTGRPCRADPPATTSARGNAERMRACRVRDARPSSPKPKCCWPTPRPWQGRTRAAHASAVRAAHIWSDGIVAVSRHQ